MGLADELLATMGEEVHTHDHVMSDPDSYFVIDPDSREITNAGRGKITIMQYDHKSEIFTFELPRYVEGHDMMLCNRVRVHFNNVDGSTNDERQDVAEMYDLAPCPADPTKVISTWCIRREATQLAGTLNFLVQYECIDDGGESVYEWHTDIFTDVYVREGRNFGELAVIEYSNVLEQWYQKLFGTGNSVIADIAATAEEKIAAIKTEGTNQIEAINVACEENMSAIQAKGAETIVTIPADYTATYNMANDALRTRANAIVITKEGESIVANDCSDDYLRGLKLYGKTEQKTTTGAQLFDASRIETTSLDGVTLTNNGDGSFTVTGTALSTGGLNVKYNTTDIVEKLKVGKLYLVADNVLTYIYVNLRDSDDNPIITLGTAENYSREADITEEKLAKIASITFGFYGQANKTITSGTTKPMLYQDGDGTWEPYTGGKASPNLDYPQELESVENPTVNIYGKNLLDISAALGNNFTESNGVYTLTRNEGGSRFSNSIPVNIPAGTPITLSVNILEYTKSSESLPLYYKGVSGKSYYASVRKTITNTYDEDIVSLSFYLASTEEVGAYVKFNNAQLELGKISTPYEPHKPIQSLALNRTLPGIPVSTDDQQWICDEIDFERGVYVQRVRNRAFDGTENWLLNEYDGYKYFLLTLNPGGITGGSPGDMCTHAEHSTWCSVSSLSGDDFFVNPHAFFSIKQGGVEYTNVDDWKTFLADQATAGTPVAIQYVLATPIETPLTDEELFNFSQLHSNYLTTAILNDSGVKMEVKYNADTQTYFNNSRGASDAQVENAVDAWLTKYFASAEGVSF